MAVEPREAVTEEGCEVMVGPAATVRVAALLKEEAPLRVTLQRNLYPLWRAATLVWLKVAEVPLI